MLSTMQAANSPPRSPPVRVEIWSLALDHVAMAVSRELLEEAERERAARFRNPSDGARWGAARAGLRTLLGARLSRDPRRIAFAASEAGKPAAVDAHGLRFSLSHSRGVALFALADDREVGIDVESEHTRVDVEAISDRFLAPGVSRGLAELPPGARRSAFFAAWTRHEAVLKCRGTGFSGPDSGPGELAVVQLEPGPGWAAALAIEARSSVAVPTSVPLADEGSSPNLRTKRGGDSRLPLDDVVRLRAVVSVCEANG
jgi:4'-phosphopantetheinyl transferase